VTSAHSRTLGDYGPAFAGLILGAATYLIEDPEHGLTAYGGQLSFGRNGTYTLQPRDALRRRLYIGPLQLFLEVDAGAIISATVGSSSVSLQLADRLVDDVVKAEEVILWIDQSFYVDDSLSGWTVQGDYMQKRAGWAVPIENVMASVIISC
jgi:hypothetical protein